MRWHWQYLVPPLLIALNVDWILMPLIKGTGANGWLLFEITSVLAVSEIVCWYHFWKWFRKIAVPEFARRATKNKDVREAIELGKEIKFDLRMAGLWDEIKTKVIRYSFKIYEKTTDENNRFMKWIKGSGAIAMIILGVSPEPGTRTFGAMFCGITGLKNGLYPLAIGNILRVAYMLGIWQVVFSFFKN